MFNEKEIYKKIMATSKELNRELSPSDITKTLRHSFSVDGLIFRTHRNKDLPCGSIMIAGDYNPNHDKNKMPCIFVDIHYAKDQHVILLTELKWRTLAIDVIECVGHESIRRKLYKCRNYDENTLIFFSCHQDDELRQEKMHFGDSDSVEAFGYSIATILYLGKVKRKITAGDIYSNEVFKMYVDMFGANHRIVGDLLQQSLKYYQMLLVDVNDGECHEQEEVESSR